MATFRAVRIDRGSFLRWACAGAMVLCWGLAVASAGTDVYVETAIDPSGQLHIGTKHHREITPQKVRGQTAFRDARISPDGRAVGWLALFPSRYSSDPIPLQLVILVNEDQRSLTGSGMPIMRWCFWGSGKLVAFAQETLHGGAGVHYELRDIETGELADKYDPDANPDMVTKPPRWVVVVDSKR